MDQNPEPTPEDVAKLQQQNQELRQRHENVRNMLIAREETGRGDFAAIENAVAQDSVRLLIDGSRVEDLPADRCTPALGVLGRVLTHGMFIVDRNDSPEDFRAVYDVAARHPNVLAYGSGRLVCALWRAIETRPAAPPAPVMNMG